MIGIGALLVMLTNAIVFLLPPLLPTIQDQYGLTTVAETTWLYTALTLGGGVSFILLPRVADIYGDRNAAVIASALLVAGATIPAIGDSYPTLLIGSVIMGFGGAAQLLPLGFLRRNLGDSGLTIAVAVLVIATGIGIVLGMIGGGYTVEHLSLRDIFIFLAVAAVATTVIAFLAIPHAPPAEPTGRIGVLGTVWMIAWVAAILLALTQGLVWGTGALIPLALGIIGGVAWMRVERRSPAAVFDAAVLKAPFVVAASTCVGLFAAVNAAFLLLLSAFAQVAPSTLPAGKGYGLGLSALQTGLLMLPFALTFLVGSVIADGPANRGRGGPVLILGACTCISGFAFLAFAHDRVWEYLVGAAMVGLGCSIGYAAGFTLVQLAVPEAKAGMAAGVAGTAMAVGFAFGTALVTGVLSASVLPVSGSTTEVAAKSLYGDSYWVAAVLAGFIVLTVVRSRARATRRGGVAVV
ncbi:MFS transporter [Flexivirga oryzae]|uniref:MFS family permease n=1 Tax=Flexivirga oryzae TaxID=1794944 RepID=A0A839N4J2_9MICO|nr:MFS transporter [Flexivirga oryzae]MBB2890984.1 MFS family permease [Flexivirga oryzae]